MAGDDMAGRDLAFCLATRGDQAGIDARLARIYPQLLKPDGPASVLMSALPIISRARPELVVSGSYWMALQGEAVVGAGGRTAAAPGDAGVTARLGHVRHLVTDDRLVRRCIGLGLMLPATEQTRSAGMRRLGCL